MTTPELSPQPNYVLRGCVRGDEAALALVGAATFLETYSGLLPGPAIISHCAAQHSAELYAKWICSSEAHICAADMKGAFVGFAMLYPPDANMSPLHGDVELK